MTGAAAGEGRALSVVDSNAHVTSPAVTRHVYPLAPLSGGQPAAAPDIAPEPSVEELVAAMDEADVSCAFLIGSRNHGFDNRYCCDSGSRYPGRFVTVANINVYSDSAVEDVRYWTGERRMHGVRLWGGGRGIAHWIDDSRFYPVWNCISELGIPANAQTTNAEMLPATKSLLERLPSLRLTVNNMAHVPLAAGTDSEAAQCLFDLARFPNVYVNMGGQFIEKAADPQAVERQFLERLLDTFGAGRLLWSVFYPSPPAVDYPAAVKAVRESLRKLSPADEALVAGGAARGLYRLEDSGRADG
jgi:predicted TIM-barrel fold metal-dependent hydrolase